MTQTNTFKERLLYFIRYMNLTTKAFEQSIGVSNSYIANLRKRMGDDVLKNTLSKYPQLNREWLLTGEGQMLNFEVYSGLPETTKLPETQEKTAQPSEEICEVEEIPIIPKVACIEPNVDTLSYVKHNDVTTSPIVHQFPTSDVWYPVFTDTMSPDYLPGDKVALFAYPKGEEEVLNNRAYVIDTKRNGTILCKLTKTDEGYIARYKNPEYPNDFIKYSDVIRIYKVVGLIRVIM